MARLEGFCPAGNAAPRSPGDPARAQALLFESDGLVEWALLAFGDKMAASEGSGQG